MDMNTDNIKSDLMGQNILDAYIIMSKRNIYKLSKVTECKQGAVRAVRFNVDGGYCLTSGSDKTVKLWNPHKETLLHTYSGHGFEVLDARSSGDNCKLASCGLDKSVIYWDVVTGQALRKYRGHVARVNCLCFNEESTVIVSASMDGSVKIWDTRSRNALQTLDEAKDNVMSVSIASSEILTSSLDGLTRIYDVRNGKLTSNCLGNRIIWSSFSEDTQCLLCSCCNSGLFLMDKVSGELLSQYSGHTTSDIKIESCFGLSDTVIFSGSESEYVYCWDLISSKILGRLEHPGSRLVHSLSHHPSESQLLTATTGQIWLWTTESDEMEVV